MILRAQIFISAVFAQPVNIIYERNTLRGAQRRVWANRGA